MGDVTVRSTLHLRLGQGRHEWRLACGRSTTGEYSDSVHQWWLQMSEGRSWGSGWAVCPACGRAAVALGWRPIWNGRDPGPLPPLGPLAEWARA